MSDCGGIAMSDFEPQPINVDGEMMCALKCEYYRIGWKLEEAPGWDCRVCNRSTHCLPWYIQQYKILKNRVEELEHS
jgi:hypothetical protein